MAVNTVLMPKIYYNTFPATSNTYAGFYQLEEDTVDVLLIGSSHTVCGMNPQYLYNETGIKSYNLGSGQQSMITSYYWLKEALRSQSPKAVVLDCMMAFPYDNTDDVLNCPEGILRPPFDYMKWSEVKWEAVNDLEQLDGDTYSVVSFLLPNIRYHSRLESLTPEDFQYAEMTSGHNQLKGYVNYPYKSEYTGYQPFSAASGSESKEDMQPVMKEYLDRIVALCSENDIELILVSVPYAGATAARYETMSEYAAQHGLTYIDMNTDEWYAENNYDFASDNADGEHANPWGAELITADIGKALLAQCPDIVNENGKEQWEDSKAYYKDITADNELMTENDAEKYVKELAKNKDRYVIFLSTKGDTSSYMTSEQYGLFQQLGLKMDIKSGECLAAVIDRGDVAMEVTKKDEATISGLIRDLDLTYSLRSSLGDSSIAVNDSTYSPNLDGINLLVYDTESEQFFDIAIYHYAADMYLVEHFNYVNGFYGN